jgi:hypothetical protein
MSSPATSAVYPATAKMVARPTIRLIDNPIGVTRTAILAVGFRLRAEGVRSRRAIRDTPPRFTSKTVCKGIQKESYHEGTKGTKKNEKRIPSSW